MENSMELLIDLFDRYTDEEIAEMADLTYEGRAMTREETRIIVSTLRASRIARGYVNGGRNRETGAGSPERENGSFPPPS